MNQFKEHCTAAADRESYLALVRFLLPDGILDYFELSKIVEAIPGLHIYLEEKNLPPSEYKDQKLESKGFLPEIYIQDFPIRNQKVILCIKRRRWEVKDTGEIISRNWNVVQQGDGGRPVSDDQRVR